MALELTAVPEPSAFGLLAVAATGLVASRRRKS
ncbi:MAG: PEP-CTERM sorting domain-containing protein [Planctomycetota bacterium]